MEVGRDRSPVAALGLARRGAKGTVPRSFLRAARRDGARSMESPEEFGATPLLGFGMESRWDL